MRILARFLPPLLLLAVACSPGQNHPVEVGDAGITGDGGTPDCPAHPSAVPSELRINEVLSDNDGVAVDELGETDDYVELYNAGKDAISLADYRMRDSSHAAAALPNKVLGPGAIILLWADDSPEQGSTHLPFKLKAKGDRLELLTSDCALADQVDIPKLATNESYARFPDGADAWSVCHYASPGKPNGKTCEPPPPPELPNHVTFKPYPWPEAWPALTGPLVITELALRPAAYVEVLNQGAATVDLTKHTLRLAQLAPDAKWPDASTGIALAWPVSELAPGARVLISLADTDTQDLEASPEFEGAATVFDAQGKAIDRVEFMHWPANAVLARFPESSHRLEFCSQGSPGSANAACAEPVPGEQADRLREIRNQGDFDMLAVGGTEVGISSVKFFVDLQAGEEPAVHFLGSLKWALHYTFIRERIYHEPALDRCDPEQAKLFQQGWYEFSEHEYFKVPGRRFLLGTLVQHASGLRTVEFAAGDVISPEQMLTAFFAAVARTPDPQVWSLRPVDASQLTRMRMVEGKAPIVGPNAPFANLHYQPLTQAVGFGTLTFVRSDALETTDLGPRTIVITDAVPNDVPFVAGLITEAFQTPLAHVNVLSRARGTPNMGLSHAVEDPRLAPLLGKLVRLEVAPTDFLVREASAEEADAYWQAHRRLGPEVIPPLDTKVRGIRALKDQTIRDLPAIGAKAAQFAELYRVNRARAGCPADSVPLHVPPEAFAIPVAHYLDHFAKSGAEKLLTKLLDDAKFRADPEAHVAGLAEVREKILKQPVDPALLAEVESAIRERYGNERVRMRSSSNTEDLPTFNGAGLHTSTSASLGDDDLKVEDALRIVWSSLWNARAFDERDFANISQRGAAMAVLVHPAERSELAQGVAISRNLMHVTRDNVYYINAQIGEASVTNPAPGVVTEQILYTFPPRSPEIEVQSRSSLTRQRPVLTLTQTRALACSLAAVHDHFRPLLDPNGQNRLFAMQVEYKFARDRGELVLKQARPQPFSGMDVPADCREF
jgi:hypothetical protein